MIFNAKYSVLFFISIYSLSINSVATDFASGNWGDTKQDIISIETRENYTPPGNQNFLVYKDKISIFKHSNIVYLFENNQLTDGYFDFQDEHILFQDYVEDYFIVQKQLSKKYALPVSNEQIWHPDAQIIEKPQWGNAIANDDLILKSIWHSDNSIITLQLSFQSNKMHHLLSYQSTRPDIEVMTPDAF
ncbi:hypothetical protein [Marinicellulosiphila megalodicopiae]|uniref:hypothetical protein n=1 Tax=Marinicellulosiphila megalodicopiae TaxID=2724896 RepID=UPI003BB18EEF